MNLRAKLAKLERILFRPKRPRSVFLVKGAEPAPTGLPAGARIIRFVQSDKA